MQAAKASIFKYGLGIKCELSASLSIPLFSLPLQSSTPQTSRQEE